MLKLNIMLKLSILFKLVSGVSGVATGWYAFDTIFNNHWEKPLLLFAIALISLLLQVIFETIAEKTTTI